MQKMAGVFLRIVVFACFLSVAMAAAVFSSFREAGVSLGQIVARVGMCGLAFTAIASAVIGRSAALYRLDYSSLQKDEKRYEASLESLGKVPLVALVIFVVLNSLYLWGLFSFGRWVGLRSGIDLPLFLLTFAIGMLNAALVYVLSDKLGTQTLLSHRLEFYPHSLREARQRIKIFIIPTFMTMMAMIFSFALTFLIVDRAGGDIRKIDSTTFATAGGVAFAFFAVIVTLVYIWNSNTGLIYNSVIAQMDQLSCSEKDLTRRISISSVDELGSIAGMVNDFCRSLSENMVELKGAQVRLTSYGAELQRSAGDSAAAVQQIASGVDRIKEKTQAQSSSVAGSSSAVQQIAKNIESLDRLIGDQSTSVTQASASIEEMVGNIESINGSIDKMAEQFSALAGAARDGTEIQETSSRRIANIAERSAALQEANTAIAAIASQTNLLAMNAAIEAAHAGEAGKGFSVVADEIRRLAETSAEETRKINSELAEVQSAIEEVVVASKSSEDSFNKVAERIGATESLVREVQAAMGEQREGAAQILDALKAMNEITSQVRTGSSEMSEGNAMVLSEMNHLQSSARDIRDGMEEMSKGASEINAGARKVSETANATQETISGMEKSVGCFKT